MQSYSKLNKNPNEILKYYKVNTINWPEDSSKLSHLHYFKTWHSSSKWHLRVPSFHIAIKRERPAFGGRIGSDWLFQKDSDDGKVWAGVSGMHPETR